MLQFTLNVAELRVKLVFFGEFCRIKVFVCHN